MCHDVAHGSLIAKTGSSNIGHGVCCKQGYNEGVCASSETHICSPGVTEGGAYDEVHTDDLNYQMFAFCPKGGNAKVCGISSDTSFADDKQTIVVTKEKQTFSTNQMKYNHGNPSTRSYDSCYYKLTPSPDADANLKYTNVKIVKKTEINSYLYGG